MIVCADDYGLREDINQAILELAGLGKLTAASCMAALESCTAERLGKLLQHGSHIDMGLHLCLTREDLSCPDDRSPSFGSLLRAALTGGVSRTEIRQRVAAQYELFVKKAGRRPDYLDGHLHAHQLPGVRDGLLDFVLSLPREDRPYVRNTAMPIRALRKAGLPWVKALLIGRFGAGFRKNLRQEGIATNHGFAGIYDFREWRRYPVYLPKFIVCLTEPTGILVVHPGQEEPWRRQEFRALMEFEFAPRSLNRFRPEPLAKQA
jgi:predicted glycoside hydrolase/deacetylase ChbG (UPF0249 family)